ncbi:UNVERIFIED_CONTAM: hypothetical protein Sindi_1915200 [Sesamum indicum]
MATKAVNPNTPDAHTNMSQRLSRLSTIDHQNDSDFCLFATSFSLLFLAILLCVKVISHWKIYSGRTLKMKTVEKFQGHGGLKKQGRERKEIKKTKGNRARVG